jgi:hypothetical protein
MLNIIRRFAQPSLGISANPNKTAVARKFSVAQPNPNHIEIFINSEKYSVQISQFSKKN